MKKIFVLIFATLIIAIMFTCCSEDENSVSVNVITKEFYTVEDRQKYADNLDTQKYTLIGEDESTHYKRRSTYDLILIENANNENYEVFQFSSKDIRKEFREKLDNNKKVSYWSANGFYYLIVVTENIAKKSTVIVKEILQNEENYIVIEENDNLIMVPKNISEFVSSSNSNTVNLETTAGTVTKAIFCITEEMKNKIQ